MRRLTTAVVCLLLAAACGGASPTSPLPGGPPVPAAAPFEGVWNLKYRVDHCQGEDYCSLVKGRTYDFSVRLVKSGLGYNGVVMLNSGQANVDVTGALDATGALLLSGMRRSTVPVRSYRDIEVKRLRLSRDAGIVSGDFEYRTYGTLDSSIGSETVRNGPLVSAVKVADITPASARELRGTWSGSVATRDCVTVGHTACTPLRPEELWDFVLTIHDAGGSATALLEEPARVTLAAAVSGSSVVVQGTAEERNTAYTTVWTVRPSTFTRDEVGRLRGSLSMEWRRTYAIGQINVTDFRVIELVDVALRPPS